MRKYSILLRPLTLAGEKSHRQQTSDSVVVPDHFWISRSASEISSDIPSIRRTSSSRPRFLNRSTTTAHPLATKAISSAREKNGAVDAKTRAAPAEDNSSPEGPGSRQHGAIGLCPSLLPSR